ncbi:hypothetical protein T8K17_01780 [Thalassobaculum sp. OXR-137]|uniref:hypothetical protein n=1 Tax=Thalassobaculum sp. OXR-137 TaxID=3100173 RepID=UPI002AC97C02|nr:hypothetical protein [Thalassobaculum sp. OXR-137]WPZ33227.1 hypothetical protein T8K17_18535 [Thalassobaculum sp. OXR-137]WPZ34880.1 hypothetical protein T8K17_01780 [Thalassobaculum sp. OXR-137]
MAPRKQKHEDIDASDIPLDAFEEGGLFVFDARPVVRNWPARIRVPIGDGQFQTHEIRIDVDYLDMDAYMQLQQDMTDYAAKGGKHGDAADPLYKHLKGWSGIAAQGKGALGYSDAAKSQLLRDPRIRGAVMEATARMVLGIEEKNSETPPEDGQPQAGGPNRAARRAAEAKTRKATE